MGYTYESRTFLSEDEVIALSVIFSKERWLTPFIKSLRQAREDIDRIREQLQRELDGRTKELVEREQVEVLQVRPIYRENNFNTLDLRIQMPKKRKVRPGDTVSV